jgi:transcriptional regulator of heat shock response
MHIGREIAILDLEDISIVSQDCLVACVPIATFAVVGPTRMNYQKAVAVVEYVAGATGEELKRF